MFNCKNKYLNDLCLTVVSLLTLLFTIPITVQAQFADSKLDSSQIETTKIQRRGTLAEQAARGEIPFSLANERFQPEMQKSRRLPPVSFPAQTNEIGKPQQIGVSREIESLRLSADSAHYEVTGGKVFLMSVTSEGASSIRARFSQMNLPKGARIFVFPLSSKDEFYGPFENSPLEDKTFWTPPVSGETIVIECFIPNAVKQQAGDYFLVSEVTHSFIGSDEFSLGPPEQPCYNEVGAGYADMARSVGHLRFTLPDGEYICTGTLLNASSGSFAPYLLTANHCFDTPSSAQSLKVYWNYNVGDYPSSSTVFTFGADLLSTTNQTDFTLVRLTGNVPGGLNYAGWEAGDPAPNTSIVGIHHPNGSHKRISFGFANAIGSRCSLSLPSNCENYIPVTWTSGTTEGGSSGSGLFYTAGTSGRLIGNLWGGAAGCNMPTKWYGRFSLTYYKISSYISDRACNYTLSSSGDTFTAAGGNSNFNLATGGDCYHSAVVTSPSSVQAYSNSTAINIADRSSSAAPGLGNPYQSTINVSGLSGTVTRTRVTLHGVSHTYPDDIDVLLVGPGGQTALVMSDGGGSPDINNTNLTFDPAGRTLLPDESALGSGIYRPSNYASLNNAESDGSDYFPSPAPGRKLYENTLSAFYGTNPNGAWRLYVIDDESGDSGSISGGWSLELATANNNSWLRINSGENGSGNSTISYSVAPNNTGQQRTGTISVGGQNFTVTQNAGGCLPASAIAPGQTISGLLQNGDCTYSDGSFYDAYTFNGNAGQQIYITMNSTQLNAYLFLIQGNYPGGAILDQNDNGGGGANARIPDNSGYFTLPATGTYTILANSRTAGEIGSYTLYFNSSGNPPPPPRRTLFDFNGDGKTDYGVVGFARGVFTQQLRYWYISINGTNQYRETQFGMLGDREVPADYDGDGKTDLAVYRNGIWYWLQSSTNTLHGIQWGIASDIPVPADYDGDGKAELAVFRQGNWYFLNISNNQARGLQWGVPSDKPVPADYDGDGKTDVGVFRNGAWYWLQSSNNTLGAAFWGLASDKPVVADYDGDGKANPAVYRNGNWYIYLSQQSHRSAQLGGNANDKLTVGDYDGDGKADVSIWRPEIATFYFQSSSTNQIVTFPFGQSNEIPIASVYVP